MDELNWPEEIACVVAGTLRWRHSGSNISLDLHGDPLHAALTVFSDGNHHMALRECLRYFAQHHTHEIFYVTLPPTVLLAEMENCITEFRVGVVDDGGARGKALVDFLFE